jgi:hypothetical protein
VSDGDLDAALGWASKTTAAIDRIFREESSRSVATLI